LVPHTYDAYFGACATVAGTLIGLLFVAISVSPHKDFGSRAPLSFQIQSAVAITTLTNALVIALLALLPGDNLGIPAVTLAGVGASSAIGMTVLSVRDWPGLRHARGLIVVPVLGCLYLPQLANGINMLLSPGDSNPVELQALLVVIFFAIAVARAWRMIGARDIRATTMVRELIQERQTPETDPAAPGSPLLDAAIDR
jgi:hypothetical protein